MKVVVDFDVCVAHGECVVAAPEIFELSGDDEVCPAAAIKVEA